MDSRDDIHDANDVHIYEEDHYNSDALYADDDDDDAGYGLFDYDSDDSDEVSVSRQQEKYTILKDDSIGSQRQEDYKTRIYSAQLVSRKSANGDEVCKALGVLDIFNTNSKTAEDKKKNRGYLVRNHTGDNRKMKRCPAPGCDFAIEFHHASGGYDVTCTCSYSFCWNCTEEAHRPVDCETVSKWILEKKNTESENMKLNLADTKACPKCKGKIEKRKSGCMHMTCKCKYEFCWVCLSEWSDHTGGLYACNRYEGAYDESLERYTHYYERWATHESSRQKAVSHLQTVDLARLSEKLGKCEAHLKFIINTWLQVVECRRVLKWSYVYGYYYLPEQQLAKIHFFEHLQGEAEVGLERLHECAEKYLDASQVEFDHFRRKLTNLTSVTHNYFDNFVSALQNGLSDVDTHREQQPTETGPTKGGGLIGPNLY